MSKAKQVWNTLVAGWPIIVAILAFVGVFSKLFLVDMIATQITEDTGKHDSIVELEKQVALLVDDVSDLEKQMVTDHERLGNGIETLNADVKATLRLLIED